MPKPSLLDHQRHRGNIVQEQANLAQRVRILEELAQSTEFVDRRYALRHSSSAVQTANYTAGAWETVLYNPSGGTFTITLPAGPRDGEQVHLINTNSSQTGITVSGNGINVLAPAGGYGGSVHVAGGYVATTWEYTQASHQWQLATISPDPTKIIYARNYADLEAALDAVVSAAPATLILEPGTTYTLTGTYTINQDNITIEGNGATIDFTGTGDVFTISSGVSGFTMRDVTATDSGSASDFIDQTGGSRTLLENVHVSDMDLYQLAIDGSNVHADLVIRRCSCTNAAGNAINLQGVENFLIESCRIVDAASDGVKCNIWPVRRSRIINNYFEGSGDNAIDLYGGGGEIIIEGNIINGNVIEVKNNGASGSRPWQHGCLIRGNEFRNGSLINTTGIYTPFRFAYDSIAGDDTTGPFEVAHNLNAEDPFIECRVFNGATELAGGGTDFSFETTGRTTIDVTFASALATGQTRQVVIGYKVADTDNWHEENVASGSSSYAVNHALNLGDKYAVDVIAWDRTTQTATAYDSITYTDADNLTVTFSGSLSNDHRIYVRVHLDGFQRLVIEDNVFLRGQAASIGSIVGNGGVEYHIRRNTVVQELGATGNSAVFNLRPPVGHGEISYNRFINCHAGSSVYLVGIQALSDNALGVPDPQAQITVQHNESKNCDNRFMQIGEQYLHRTITDNVSRDFGGNPNNQFVGSIPAEGYTSIFERNYNVVAGVITQTFGPPVSSFADGDATPNVQGRHVWSTANTGATTYTDFDGFVEDGYRITIIIGDANCTFDFSGTALKGNAASDLSPASGDVLHFVHYSGNWYLLGHADIA